MKKKQIIILLLALALSVFSLSAYAENEEDIYLTRGELCTLIAENLQLDTVNIPKESPFTDLSITDENYAGIVVSIAASLQRQTETSLLLTRQP